MRVLLKNENKEYISTSLEGNCKSFGVSKDIEKAQNFKDVKVYDFIILKKILEAKEGCNLELVYQN